MLSLTDCLQTSGEFLVLSLSSITLTLDLGINELFHIYAHRAIDAWFDLELREGQVLLLKIPVMMEARWRRDFLEVGYDSSAGESYYVLLMQVGDIDIPFEPSIKEIRTAMLDRAYKAKISSCQNMLSCYINLSPPPTKEESKVIHVEAVHSADKEKALVIPPSEKRRVSAEQKQLVLAALKTSA